MLVTQAGLYRGHFGEVDSRGRIFSGHPKDESLRAGICLTMGKLSSNDLSDAKDTWQELLSRWYSESPDSGTHSVACWALRQWKVDLPEITPSTTNPVDRDWNVTPHGFTMIRIPAGQFERTDGRLCVLKATQVFFNVSLRQ